MPLTSDISAVADFHDIQRGAEWTKTEGLIFATMSIGMDEITAENAGEFYARIKVLEGMIGSFVTVLDGEARGHEAKMAEYYFNTADIQRRIGLKTNGGRETRTKFLNRMLKIGIEFYAKQTKGTKVA
jgi:hypothetical protein